MKTAPLNSAGAKDWVYYEESLVSSNLNSKQLRFHGFRPNVEGGWWWLSIAYAQCVFLNKIKFPELKLVGVNFYWSDLFFRRE